MCKINENASTFGVENIEKVNRENVDFNRIYLYKNLSFGVPARENREINKAHVKNIYKKMDENLLELFVVDIDTGIILDGNHRWLAVEKYLQDGNKMKKPFRVRYESKLPNESVCDAIIRLNAHRKQWSTQDYIDSKRNEGDKYASELHAFCNERKWLHKETIDKRTGAKTLKPIMRYGGWFIKGCNCSPMFKRGEYTHTPSELENAKFVYDEIEKIMDAADITKTGTWFGEFVQAWRTVREEQKEKINSLPNGFESLIPYFKKKTYVREDTLMNQVGPNKRNLESVIDDAVEEEVQSHGVS